MKLLLLLSSILFLPLCTNAQGLFIELGANISDLNKSSDYENNSDFKIGYQVGVSKTFFLSKSFSFHPQVSIALKREYYEGDITIPTDLNSIETGRFSDNEKEYFFEVPFNFRFNFELHSTTIFLLAGPYMNFLIHDASTETVEIRNVKTNNLIIQPTEISFTKNLDYGLNFGFGLQKKDLLLKASCGYGLTRNVDYYYDLENNPLESYTQTFELRNVTYRFSIGYHFF